MTQEAILAKLSKAGITITDNKIAAADLEKALAALTVTADEEDEEELEDMNFDELKDKANIKEDGIGVLNLYMEKYCKSAKGKNLSVSLEDFKNDVEEYAMPAIEKMIDYLDNLE